MAASMATPLRPARLKVKLIRSTLIVILGMILLVQLQIYWSATVDDAFISYRYSERWAQGQGLTYNDGERVEGFSNFSWVALLALVRWLGLDVVIAAKVAGIINLLLILWLAWRILNAAGYHSFAVGIALVALGVSNSAFIFMAVGGMETIFLAMLLMLLLDRLQRHDNQLSLSAALLLLLIALTRPEGIAYTVALIPTLWWLERRLTRKTILLWALIFAGYALFLFWRWNYYGALAPNTFYAKPSPGSFYGVFGLLVAFWLTLPTFAQFINWSGGVVALLLLPLVAWQPKWQRLFLPTFAVIAVGAAFQLYAVSDWMNLARFLLPVWMPFTVMVIVGWQELSRRLQLPTPWRKALLSLWVGCTLLFNLGNGAQFWSAAAKFPNFVLISTDMITASHWIAERYPEHYRIVCWRIGALGYYTRLTIIDNRFGLTDAHIARLVHENQLTDAANDEYLRLRNPELIIEQAYGEAPPLTQITKGGRAYRFVQRFPQGSDEWWDLYERADLNPSGQQAG